MSTTETTRDKVIAERQRRRQSQAEFAEAAGVPLRTYQAFEAGEHKSQRTTMAKILREAGIDQPATAEADRGAETRERWAPDIRVYLDMEGAWLETLSEEDRLAYMHEQTVRIIQGRH